MQKRGRQVEVLLLELRDLLKLKILGIESRDGRVDKGTKSSRRYGGEVLDSDL